MKAKRGITMVNDELRALNVPLKLVRGRGYYYFVDRDDSLPTLAFACRSQSVPCYLLEATKKDVSFALFYIADCLTDCSDPRGAQLAPVVLARSKKLDPRG